MTTSGKLYRMKSKRHTAEARHALPPRRRSLRITQDMSFVGQYWYTLEDALDNYLANVQVLFVRCGVHAPSF